jgi:hypothetical protein
VTPVASEQCDTATHRSRKGLHETELRIQLTRKNTLKEKKVQRKLYSKNDTHVYNALQTSPAESTPHQKRKRIMKKARHQKKEKPKKY